MLTFSSWIVHQLRDTRHVLLGKLFSLDLMSFQNLILPEEMIVNKTLYILIVI